MEGLHFGFDDMLREINAFEKIGKPFVDRKANDVLGRLRSTLEEVRKHSPGTTTAWGVEDGDPLKTRETSGYEPGGRGAHRVVGEMASTWSITPANVPRQGRQPPKCFCVAGLASVRLRIVGHDKISGEPCELAMWRMELGSPDSPGCYFHAQILGQREESPFPKSLSVPRLPALLFSPLAAFEFLIGELFQDEWRQHSARETAPMQIWRSVQQQRLSRLLDWQHQQIRKCSGSPWTALKAAKPHHALFVEKC